ncbi:MAG TPA: ATP-binding protein [Chloroflexota bacterium]
MVVATPVYEDEATSLPSTALAGGGVGPADFHLGVLFERGLDAVVVADLDSGCIVLWNPAAERLFGYSAVEAIGQPIEILMDEGIGAVHHAGLDRYRQTGRGLIIDAGKPVEVPAMSRAGQDIRVELTLSPLAAERPGRFVLGVMRDVTDRKRVELMQFELARVHNARSEAEAAIAARDDFLAGVAAEHGYEKLERFARALVDLKLIDAGQLALHLEETDLALVVRQTAAAARDRMRGHRLVMRGASCVMTRCDPVRMAEVVDNLLDNAMTHNPDGCLIEVCIRRPRRTQVEISVRDHGVGVAPGRRERLFERYYRATPGGAGAGAGLGLHLSRRLVELHGGSLDAAFPPTGGMVLVATLPMPG